MSFKQLDDRMRAWEGNASERIPSEVFVVARLDGRGFTRLTKEICQLEAPFDIRFRDIMLSMAQSLMNCGFHVVYAYCQSDEVSLLLDRKEQQFGRKKAKYISTLAGEASARFSLLLGYAATFDCRLSLLPSEDVVVDYFVWRCQDAARNSLNAWCYWTLRKIGLDQRCATKRLEGLSVIAKRDLLAESGVDAQSLPAWQTNGVGLWWETYERPTVNPITKERVTVHRRRIRTEYELPDPIPYAQFVRELISVNSNAEERV